MPAGVRRIRAIEEIGAHMRRGAFGFFLSLFIALFALVSPALAEEPTDVSTYYLGDAVNAGLDTGYAEANEIGRDDPHFGWRLGQFSVSGYTSVERSPEGHPVFLKVAGDQVRLSFRLDQDIDALNGNSALSINDDGNGSDVELGVPMTDFGRGALVVRQTNYQNETLDPQVYTDYLAGVEQGADTEVQLFEEGDYEVALDYEVRDDPRRVGPVSIVPGYSNYRICFRFSVRNGNCMVFPFDAETHSELSNESYAPSGFYLDLARSRYLDVYVKREVMAPGADGLVEDVRFNGPARDGDMYTEDGVYTITASNEYTGQTTEKVIYVGDDPVLKAHAVTGLSVPEINQRVAAGEVITDDGRLAAVPPGADEGGAEEGAVPEGYAPVALAVLALAAAGIVAAARLHGRAPKKPEPPSGDGDEAQKGGENGAERR